MRREEQKQKLYFFQMSENFFSELPVRRLLRASAGDTMLRIYQQAHCVALRTGGVLELHADMEPAEEIALLIGSPATEIPMIAATMQHCLAYGLISTDDGSAGKIINFSLTATYTRAWTRDAIARREKREAERLETAEGVPVIEDKAKKKEAAVRIAKADVDRIVTAWNATDLPEVMRMTDKRRKKVAARVKSFGVDNVLKAIGKAGKSDLCHKIFEGKKEPWCDFDWLMKDDDNMAKTLEGKYDNADTAQAPAQEQVTPVNDDTVKNTILKEGIFNTQARAWDRTRFEEVRPKLSPEMAAAIEAKMG